MDFTEKKYQIAGQKIYLRSLEKVDASEKYAAWLNDPVVNQYLETRTATVVDLEKYIAEKSASPQCLFFGIFTNDTSEHIGNVKLEPIDLVTKIATMGILIGEINFWGKGIATEVTNLITDFAFSELGLKEIRLGVDAENVSARRVYEKCGFTIFKIDKDAHTRGNIAHDQVWMQRLAIT